LASYLNAHAAWRSARAGDGAIDVRRRTTQLTPAEIGGQSDPPEYVLTVELAGTFALRTAATWLTSGSAPVALETVIVSTSFIEVIWACGTCT
jgi:hypothetical protein